MSGLRLDVLGFDPRLMSEVRRLSSLPYGCCSSPGRRQRQDHDSLRAISETQTARDKIVTIEDPVEYQLAGVLQIP